VTDFRYTARTAAGAVVRGRLNAGDAESAAAGLRRRALFVTSLAPVKARARDVRRLRPGGGWGRARVAFFRSFATLVRAGVPLRRGLTVAIERAQHRAFADALREVLADIERGEPLSVAFGRRPRAFAPLIVAMVAAGESGGILDDVLDRIAVFLERDDALRKSVAAALAYPATVLAASLALLAFLIVRVVPMFATLFASFHVALPLSTRVLVTLGDLAARPSTLTLAGVLTALAVIACIAAQRTRGGRYAFDRLRLNLPLIGTLLRKTIVARVARMLGTLVHSGIELSVALDVVVPVTGSPVHEAALAHVAIALREGEALTPPLAATGLFDPMLIALIGVGEETGMLDAMLPKAAEYFETDVAATIATLGAVLEPALIAVLGVIVGLIVYSVFIPLYSLIGSVSS
jgi:type IV pilus assembly protein PilC